MKYIISLIYSICAKKEILIFFSSNIHIQCTNFGRFAFYILTFSVQQLYFSFIRFFSHFYYFVNVFACIFLYVCVCICGLLYFQMNSQKTLIFISTYFFLINWVNFVILVACQIIMFMMDGRLLLLLLVERCRAIIDAHFEIHVECPFKLVHSCRLVCKIADLW